jgi:hypothetical protein
MPTVMSLGALTATHHHIQPLEGRASAPDESVTLSDLPDKQNALEPPYARRQPARCRAGPLRPEQVDRSRRCRREAHDEPASLPSLVPVVAGMGHE